MELRTVMSGERDVCSQAPGLFVNRRQDLAETPQNHLAKVVMGYVCMGMQYASCVAWKLHQSKISMIPMVMPHDGSVTGDALLVQLQGTINRDHN
jgi:hypothetical protein